MKKRIISFALVIVLLMSMLPVNVLAENSEGYAEGDTIWLAEGVTPTQESHPVDTQRGDQWVQTGATERQLICGVESHSHTYKCAENCDKIHTHGDDCYEKAWTCGITAHVHTDEACRTLVWDCGLTASAGHAHTAECEKTVWDCGQEASEGHAHTDCATETLNCQEEHEHAAECYETVYSCGLTAGDGAHSHEGCPSHTEKTCTLEVGAGAHDHSGCTSAVQQTCTLDEHTHSVEVCSWEKTTNLACTADTSHVCVTEGCAEDCAETHHTESCYANMVQWGVANYALTQPADNNVTIQLNYDGTGATLSGQTVTITDSHGNAVHVNGGYDGALTTDADGKVQTYLTEGSYIATVTNFTDSNKNTYTGSVAFTVAKDTPADVTLSLTAHAPKTVRVRLEYDDSYNYQNRTVTLTDAAGTTYTVTINKSTGNNYNRTYYGEITLPIGQYTATTSFASGSYDYSATQAFTITDDTAANSYVDVQLVRLGDYDNAESRYESKVTNKGYFDHVDIRVNGDFSINGKKYPITIANAILEVLDANGNQKYYQSFANQNNETYEWRKTGIRIYTDYVVKITFDILYDGETVVNDYVATYSGRDDFIYGIQNCDMQQGLDFRISESQIMEAVSHVVSYNWTGLPEGAATLPQSSSELLPGTVYSVNTSYYQGYRVPAVDPDTNVAYYYVFDGWEYYMEGNHRTDLNPYNPGTITVNNDIVIWGEWTRTDEKVPTAQGYITLTKTFKGLTEMPAGFYVNVTHDGKTEGIDAATHITSSALNADGDYVWTYKFPVSSNGEYTFTEDNYAVDGYEIKNKTSTAASAEGTTYVEAATGTDTITTAVSLPLASDTTSPIDPAGTVSFTNEYAIQEAIAEVLPTITVHKYQENTAYSLAGAEFTLTPVHKYVYDAEGNRSEAVLDENYKTQTLTTGANGRVTSEELHPGAYTLQETKAPAGYVADDTIYHVYVLQDRVVTELQEVEGVLKYVTTTYYATHVGEGSATTDHPAFNVNTNTLAVYNKEILGTMNFIKEFALYTTRLDLNITNGASITLHVTGPDGYSEYVEIKPVAAGEQTNWSAQLENLKPGEYTITETNTSLHGYNWKEATFNVTGGVYTEGADKKSVTVTIPGTAADPQVNVQITNSYIPWSAAEFFVHKVDGTTNEHLSGVAFTLYSDAACTVPVAHSTTDANGEAYFGNLDEAGTFYLKEVTPRVGYEPQTTVWTVEVTVADNTDGTKSYDVTINSNDFNHGTDTLKVTNVRKKGSLTISKDFGDGNEMPEKLKELKEIYVLVTGPDGTITNVTLSQKTDGTWESETLTDLEWGDYTVQEIHADFDGYKLETLYNGEPVSSKVITVDAHNAAEQSVLITNTYDKQEAAVHNPTYFNVLKHDSETHAPLPGATFRLFANEACTVPLTGVSFNTEATTNANGFAYFGDIKLSEEYEKTSLICYMKEVGVPDGYELLDDSVVWTVTISEDGLEAIEVLNKDKNIFENIFDWIVSVTGGQTDNQHPDYGTDSSLGGDNTISVHNTRKSTKLKVKKVVEFFVPTDAGFKQITDVNTINYLIGLDDAIVPDDYSITATINGTANALTLANGEEKELDLSYNTAYSVVETIPENAPFVLQSVTNSDADESSKAVTNGTSGIVELDDLGTPVEVVFTNRYYYGRWNGHEDEPTETDLIACLKLKKVTDATDNPALAGARFQLYKQDASEDLAPVGAVVQTDDTGILHFDVTEAGTYVLKEVFTPEGYKAPEQDTTIQVTESFERTTYEGKEYIVRKLTATVNGTELKKADYDLGTYVQIVNEVNPGKLTVSKIFNDGKRNFTPSEAKVLIHVHGPIDENNVAESFKNVQTITLEDTVMTGSLEHLEKGTYYVHEAFASLHGYNWGSVAYSAQNTVRYPDTQTGETYAVIEVEGATPLELTATNYYTEWQLADFYVHKTDNSNPQKALEGVVFTLHDQSGSHTCADACKTATTDASGHARFTELGPVVDEKGNVSGYTSERNGVYHKLYYLEETGELNNYQDNQTIYTVDVTVENQTDGEGQSKWVYDITVTSGGTLNGEDELHIVNVPVTGNLMISKQVTGLDSFESLNFHVTGPNGYSEYVTLTGFTKNQQTNMLEAQHTLTGLRMGTYKIAELDANRTGYDWKVYVNGSENPMDKPTDFVEVTLDRTNVNTEGTPVASVSFKNAYTKKLADPIENPATLTIYKSDPHGKPLSGAKFTLYDAENKPVAEATTKADGLAEIQVKGDKSQLEFEGDKIKENKIFSYTLKETAAPTGYLKTDTVWNVEVSADQGTIKLDVLNRETGIFETIIDWIVSGFTKTQGTNYEYDNGRLHVTNVEATTTLTVKKTVKYMLDGVEKSLADVTAQFPNIESRLQQEYAFRATVGTETKLSFKLKHGEQSDPITVSYNDHYTVEEVVPANALFVQTLPDNASGTIGLNANKTALEPVTVEVVNTYHFWSYDDHDDLVTEQAKACLIFRKVDKNNTNHALAGATFTLYKADGTKVETQTTGGDGVLHFHVTEAGKYYLMEDEAPADYKKLEGRIVEVTVKLDYQVMEKDGHTVLVDKLVPETYESLIKNEKLPISVTVEKIWDDDAFYGRPASIQMQLMKDGNKYEQPVKLEADAAGKWTYTWENLDPYAQWTVQEVGLDAALGYDVDYSELENGTITVINTRVTKTTPLTIQKVWKNNGAAIPNSIKVDVYRNGIKFETVELTKAEKWTKVYNITDNYEWEFDEVEVEGYYGGKPVLDAAANTLTITNYAVPTAVADLLNPKTSDGARLFLWSGMALSSLLCVGAMFLLRPRKKGKYVR